MSWGVATQNGVSVSLASIVSLSCGATEFSPASLFTSGVAGAWYDPSDVLLNLRTNLLTYSQEFDNAAWSKISVTVTANATTAPDGTTTAELIYPTTTGASRSVYQTINAGNVVSVYAKANGISHIWFIDKSGGAAAAWFNLSTGAVGTLVAGYTSSIESVGNGWYRCVLRANTGVFTYAQFGLSDADNSLTSTTSGTSGIYAWGAQLELGSTATTYQAITTPEQTYLLYDPQPVLYQDSAGTTPVTAVEQAVRLMLDKSQGLALGSEIISVAADRDFSSNTGYWSFNSGVGISGGSMNWSATPDTYAGYTTSNSITTPGKYYEVTWTLSSISSGGIKAGAGAQYAVARTVAGTYTDRILAASAANRIAFVCVGTTTASIDNVSVKEVAGNHALAPNDPSRPILRARYNLLTYSEQFDNAVWSITGVTRSNNTQTAPDGTVTAETITGSLGTNAVLFTTGAYTALAGNLTVSGYIKAGTADYAVLSLWSGSSTNGVNLWVNVQTGAVGSNSVTAGFTFVSGSSTAVGNGWYRVVLTGTVPAGSIYYSLRLVDGDNAFVYANTVGKTLFVWGADLRTGSSAGTYQRIAAATDYATAGFLPYLNFITDDSFGTNSIDFTATDAMSVCAGVTKLVDTVSGYGCIAELSADFSANSGTFNLFGPASAPGGQPDFGFSSKGSLGASAAATGNAAPITRVLTGQGDISADVCVLRVNAVDAATSSSNQGTGNFGNYPLFIGRRNNSLYPFNGNIYSLLVVGKTLSASELAATESWVAAKTGVSL